MLNNRKSMLALLLGMSLAVTFPVGVDASDKGADTAQETMQDSENTTDSVQDTENTESTESEPPQPETRATEAESETTADTKAEETQESEEIQTETQQSEPDETDLEDTKEKDQDLDEKAAQREKEKEKAKDKKDSSKSEKDAMSEQKFDERFEKLVIDPEELEKSFRFETVAKEYALAKADLKIYTAKNSHADVAGTLAKDGLCYILWKGKNWSYVESGNVRGYVKNKNVLTGEVVRVKVALKKEGFMTLAKAKIDPKENPAYASVKKTIQETVVKRVNAVAKENELNVREEKSTDARVVGVIPQGGLCYILADQGQEWCYVESGDVRGFVKSELLLTGKEADAIVKATKRKNMTLATEEIRPEENRALYYTFTSTQKAHSEKVKYLGKFKLTAYCACQICCGEFANGITASGTVPIQGQTVAMYGVPFGTKLIVDDVVYTVEDRGTPYGHIENDPPVRSHHPVSECHLSDCPCHPHCLFYSYRPCCHRLASCRRLFYPNHRLFYRCPMFHPLWMHPYPLSEMHLFLFRLPPSQSAAFPVPASSPADWSQSPLPVSRSDSSPADWFLSESLPCYSPPLSEAPSANSMHKPPVLYSSAYSQPASCSLIYINICFSFILPFFYNLNTFYP